MTTKTALDWVTERYEFPSHPVTGAPWTFKPKQIEVINDLALNWNAGYWLEMSVGKTACATAVGLYHHLSLNHQVFVLMPPVLLTQWASWLRSIKDKKTGQPLSVTVYRGTPTQRRKQSLDNQFILMSYGVFIKDFERLLNVFSKREFSMFADEANALSNTETQTHQKFFEFSNGKPRGLLTGTPAGRPLDAYGLLRFTNPTAYRSYNQFFNLHVEEQDFFGKPTKYRDVDRIYKALEMNSKRVLFREVHNATEPPLYVVQQYELAPEHQKLYKTLAEEKLKETEEGGKIDLTAANKLLHALGQVVVNWAHFAEDPKLKSAAIEIVEEMLEDLGNKKLLVFVHYKMTVAALLREFPSAVSLNSETADRDEAIRRFVQDKNCRLLVINPRSGGFGLDGLQYVCHNILWLEPCTTPRDFHQANARLDRTGQTERVVVRLAIARQTSHPKRFRQLLQNDEDMGSVVRTAGDLRNMIFGDWEDAAPIPA